MRSRCHGFYLLSNHSIASELQHQWTPLGNMERSMAKFSEPDDVMITLTLRNNSYFFQIQ